MHHGMCIALILALTLLFSLYLLNTHLQDLDKQYHVCTYMQGWMCWHRPGLFQLEEDGLH